MTFTIEPFIVGTLGIFAFCPLMRWNDRFHLLTLDPIIKRLRGIAPISNDSFKSQTFNQRNGLSNIRFLSSRQLQPEWITQTIDRHMNLGTESTTTTAQRLGLLAATFFWRQPRKDEHGQRCCQSSRFPYPGHRQSGLTSVPKSLGHTSGQSVCKHCSIFHTLLVTTAIGSHFEKSKELLRQIGGNLLHFYQYMRSGLLLERPGLLSIVCLQVSSLS